MTHHTPAPLWEQLLILFLAPPLLAGITWARSRGWAQTVQGEDVSKRTENRQRSEFWVLLIVLYVGLLGIFAYGWWIHR